MPKYKRWHSLLQHAMQVSAEEFQAQQEQIRRLQVTARQLELNCIGSFIYRINKRVLTNYSIAGLILNHIKSHLT